MQPPSSLLMRSLQLQLSKFVYEVFAEVFVEIFHELAMLGFVLDETFINIGFPMLPVDQLLESVLRTADDPRLASFCQQRPMQHFATQISNILLVVAIAFSELFRLRHLST